MVQSMLDGSEKKPLRRFLVPVSRGLVCVSIDQIDWIESAGNYVVLHCGKENHVLRATLRSVEDSLPPGSFLRVSRSALIRIDRVKELASAAGGPPALVLQDGTRIGLTRGWREIQTALCYL